MLLRIIDNYTENNNKDAVRIVLEYNDKSESFYINSYRSPFTDNFRKSLIWYFNDYPQTISENTDHLDIVGKLIKFGQYIGDELLGEDHQLIKIKETIEKQGYENLQVQLESASIEFFTELWETLILPESKYVLSAVVNGYTRRFVQRDFFNNYSELHYDLKVTPSTQDNLTKLLQGDQVKASDHTPKSQKPLRILYLVSRPVEFELPFSSSNSINLSLDAIATGGAIDYEVHQATDWQRLKERLSDKTRPVHILHYDGPVIIENGIANFVFAHSNAVSSRISTTELCKNLLQNKLGVLCVDARLYLQNNEFFSAAEGLATIAQCAHQQGLGNVIGLGQITNPWTSAQCFDTIYSKIAKGLSLQQAVVEARKALQAKIETSFATTIPIPFHPWLPLTHYSKQSVNFFSAPQDNVGLDNLQELELFREKLFGFQTAMLPPFLTQVSDGQVLPLINNLMHAQQSGCNQTISIIGESGTGKSQLVHVASLYLAQKQYIDYAFYFNFNSDWYTPDDILEMIAPILELKVDQKSETEKQLTQLHCCFVLDNISCKEDQPKELWEGLNDFLRKLMDCGHILIITGESHSVLHDLSSIKINTAPLSLIEQKIIAADTLRQLALPEDKLAEVGLDKNYENLLTSLAGNPWLTKKVIPLLSSFSASELNVQLMKHIDSKKNNSIIDQYYEWQWVELQPIWRRLLTLCSDVRNLLLEMLMAATEQKKSSIPAKNLFELLGNADVKFSDGLDLWQASGFLQRLPHGRTVDARCLQFLKSKRDACFDGVDQQKLKLYFSQLICEGIRLLSQHVVKQPNPAISNNLLFNRRHWVKYFEELWFNRDYTGFISVKNVFDQLLLQAKLENESKAWSLDLLERSSPITTTDDTSIEAKLCWLILASNAFGQAEVKSSKCIAMGAAEWRNWFNLYIESVDKQQLPLFQQVATFLESFYQSQANWRECITICEQAYSSYTQHNAWKRVIQSLKSLANYHVELGEKDQALNYENKIIDDIPYADAPPGFQAQQMLDILFARLSRADTRHAQILLYQLRSTDEAEKLADMLDGVQCDLHYQEENYLAALPYYCKIWTRALQSNQQSQIEHLKLRLIELEEKLGQECFNENFEREVPVATTRPKDFTYQLLH